jgi:hypothetical protein
MSGGRRTPYTDEQDKLILGCPYGSLQDLSSGMGRSYKVLCARRNVLMRGQKMERVHKGLKPRPTPTVSKPFVRPDWFDEDLGSMSQGVR